MKLSINSRSLKSKTKKHRMPKAAVLLDRTQEFESVTDSVMEGMDLIDSTEEADREEEWTDRTALEEDEREPDPRVQIVDRTAFYELTEEETAPEPEETSNEAAQGPEKALPAEMEAPEQESEAKAEPGTDAETQPAETEPAEAGEQPKKRRSIEAAEAGEQPKKRRSIEELLGMRKEKKRSENPEQNGAEPVKAAEEPAEEAKPVPAELAKKAEASEPVSASVETAETPEPPLVLPEDEPVIRKPESGKKEEEEAIPVRRVSNVPAMILFFIVAIPSVPVMLALLALITALFVSLSFGMIALGSILVISAFSGFAVLADILLLLGAAIIALALGLLFLWLAIWLVAGGMAGLIRSVRELYREWCFKEVPAA